MENLQANSWKYAKFNLATDLWVMEGVKLKTEKGNRLPEWTFWAHACSCPENSLKGCPLHNPSVTGRLFHSESQFPARELIGKCHIPTPCSNPTVPEIGYNTTFISASTQHSVWNSKGLVNLSPKLNDKPPACFSCVNMELENKIQLRDGFSLLCFSVMFRSYCHA